MSRLRARVVAAAARRGGARARRPARARVVRRRRHRRHRGGDRAVRARRARSRLLEREPQLGGRAGGFEHALATRRARADGARLPRASSASTTTCARCSRRIDPDARACCTPLADYPILGPGGAVQSFRDAADGVRRCTSSKLAWRTPYLRLCATCRASTARARWRCWRFDPTRTYAALRRHERARLPRLARASRRRARRMLFDVFSHSFFNPEARCRPASC